MKKSVKAALWSAFVFPGAGHFMLRHYARGFVLLGATVCAAYYVVHDIMARGLIDKVNDLTSKILSGEVSSDLGTAAGLLDLGPDPIGVQIASWVIVACWIAGIVDSYRIGLRQDRSAVRPGDKPQAR